MTNCHRINFPETNQQFECPPETDVLEGMTKLGKRGIPVGCKGGGCGVCKVEVVKGNYRKGIMSRQHISEAEEQCNHVLACRIYPETDLEIKITGHLKKAFGLK